MNWLLVAPQDRARAQFTAARCTHAISLMDVATPAPDLSGVIPPENWLRLDMEQMWHKDLDVETLRAERAMTWIIAWARALPENAIVGINCHFGQSRSPAVALVVAVAREGLTNGCRTFRRSTRLPTPTMGLVGAADRMLGLHGALTEFADRVIDANLVELNKEAKRGPKLVERYDADVEKLLREYGMGEDPD